MTDKPGWKRPVSRKARWGLFARTIIGAIVGGSWPILMYELRSGVTIYWYESAGFPSKTVIGVWAGLGALTVLAYGYDSWYRR